MASPALRLFRSGLQQLRLSVRHLHLGVRHVGGAGDSGGHSSFLPSSSLRAASNRAWATATLVPGQFGLGNFVVPFRFDAVAHAGPAGFRPGFHALVDLSRAFDARLESGLAITGRVRHRDL